MGNCLVLQETPVNEMKTYDKIIIDYKSQNKVHQMLPIFSHHEIYNKLVHPNTEYLLPQPVAAQPAKKTKTVGFSDDVVEEERRAAGLVRIKLVISQQELQAMLGADGVSVENMSSQVQTELNINKIESINRDYGNMPYKGWLPTLESIPEVN